MHPSRTPLHTSPPDSGPAAVPFPSRPADTPDEGPALAGSAPPGPVIARLSGASKRYGATTALEPTDLELRAGEVVALLGPNGAGKTTTVHLLLGLLRASTGTARLFGEDPRSASARSRIGAMLQIAKVPDVLTVREHVELVRTGYVRPLATAEVLAAAGLGDLADRRFGELSGGQKQRVFFALALAGDPELLFLDEPTVGLDADSRRALWAVIRERVATGTAVVLTTHYLEEAEALADRIVVLADGRIVADGARDEIVDRSRRRKVRARTTLDADALRTLPGVVSVAVHRDRAELDVVDPAEDAVRALLAHDPGLRDLEVERGGLEDALGALLGSDSRDDEVAA